MDEIKKACPYCKGCGVWDTPDPNQSLAHIEANKVYLRKTDKGIQDYKLPIEVNFCPCCRRHLT